MAFEYHKPSASTSSGSGNYSSYYEISLETNDNGAAYLLIYFDSGKTTPVGVWCEEDYKELQKQLKFNINSIPVYWKNEKEGPHLVDMDLNNLTE